VTHYPSEMGKIAVTGGAGFVGANLVRALLKENHDVVIIDDFSTGLRSNLSGLECQVSEISLIESKKVKRVLDTCEYIFHLGARGSVPRSIRNPRATMEVNSMGTLNVLESARSSGAMVAFASSSSVYGSNPGLPKDEKMLVNPLTPYAASKLSGEALVASYAAAFDVSAITYRFFNIFGPWQRPDHDYAAVIPKWIWNLMHNKRIEVFGDGTQSRDFTYIETVVSVLIQGLKEKVTHPNPVNLAFGNCITLNQCIDQLRFMFPELEVKYLPERKGDVRHSQNNPDLLKAIFPKIKPISFPDALELTYEWFGKHGSRITNGPRTVD
jgi:UDP-glucose 4-epimerase